MTGKKAVDFDSKMQALGVQYNLEDIWDGQLTIQNKPGRLERILQLTKEFNESKKGEGQVNKWRQQSVGFSIFLGALCWDIH